MNCPTIQIASKKDKNDKFFLVSLINFIATALGHHFRHCDIDENYEFSLFPPLAKIVTGENNDDPQHTAIKFKVVA